MSAGRDRSAAKVGVGRESIVLHHDTVRSDDGTLANVDAVEHHRLFANTRARADAQAVDLEDAIFETVRLKLTRDGRVVAEREHVRIDQLREA